MYTYIHVVSNKQESRKTKEKLKHRFSWFTCVQSVGSMSVHDLLADNGLHLRDVQDSLLLALHVGAGDVVSTFANLHADVVMHALKNIRKTSISIRFFRIGIYFTSCF